KLNLSVENIKRKNVKISKGNLYNKKKTSISPIMTNKCKKPENYFFTYLFSVVKSNLVFFMFSSDKIFLFRDFSVKIISSSSSFASFLRVLFFNIKSSVFIYLCNFSYNSINVVLSSAGMVLLLFKERI